MSSLRNPTAARWDPDKAFDALGLGSCFPGKITFADVDMEVEIGGRFLVVEGKRVFADGNLEPLKQGQQIAMDARVRDGRTVLIIWGDPDANSLLWMKRWPDGDVCPATWQTFHNFCAAWASWAKNNKRLNAI